MDIIRDKGDSFHKTMATHKTQSKPLPQKVEDNGERRKRRAVERVQIIDLSIGGERELSGERDRGNEKKVFEQV